MPELPEVEAARRAVQDHCAGKKIKRAVVADDSKVVDGVSAADFQASLVGKTIVSARRKGKNMWLQLDSPPFPSFQFGMRFLHLSDRFSLVAEKRVGHRAGIYAWGRNQGMAGAIYIKGVAVVKYKRSAVKDTDEWPSKYSKLFIELEDGIELSFTDKRRFAKVRLLQDPASVPPISELGPDMLTEAMPMDDFITSLTKKKTAIKALLLDQSYVSGIGNWIADEVLYQARIHPLQIASSLSRESCMALHKCIKEVIHYAVEVDADSYHFPLEWLFHYRSLKKQLKLRRIVVTIPVIGFFIPAKRSLARRLWMTTAYVPELQKLSEAQGARESSKARKRASGTEAAEDADADKSGDEDRDTAKLKNRRNATKGGRKKLAAEGKFEDSVADDNDSDNDHQKKITGKAKNATRAPVEKSRAKRKPKDSGDDGDSDGEDKHDHRTTRKMTKMKQTGKFRKQVGKEG